MTQDILITGFPRSGTSYFCKLLNEIDNFAIINEPSLITSVAPNLKMNEIENFPIFNEPSVDPHLFFNEHYSSNLVKLYQFFRRQIKAGNQIRNKVVEDTFQTNVRSMWAPTNIKDDDFVLGIKNTDKFLFSLNSFFKQESHIKVIVLIRHPYNNISSWKNSFEHLRTANLAISKSKAFRRYHLSHEQKFIFDTIRFEENESIRRCLLWNLEAQCILAHKERVSIIKYEEWIESPAEIVSDLFQLPLSALPSTITKSTKQKSPIRLSDDEMRHISTICKHNANLLGYEL